MLRKNKKYPRLRGIEKLVAGITKAIRSEKIVKIFVLYKCVSVRDFVSYISEKQLIFNLFVIALKYVKNKKSN